MLTDTRKRELKIFALQHAVAVLQESTQKVGWIYEEIPLEPHTFETEAGYLLRYLEAVARGLEKRAAWHENRLLEEDDDGDS